MLWIIIRIPEIDCRGFENKLKNIILNANLKMFFERTFRDLSENGFLRARSKK